MPNWCMNNVTITHEDPAQIDRIVNGFKAGKFFNTVIPMPEELRDTTSPSDGPNWYDWSISNWGVKWDVGGEDSYCEPQDEGRAVGMNFESAWGPPLGVYDALEQQGFTVEAYYWEPGMAFCGVWQNGADDHYEITGDSAWVEENIPADINTAFEISGAMEMWETD